MKIYKVKKYQGEINRISNLIQEKIKKGIDLDYY